MSTSSYLLRSTLLRPFNPAILPIPSRSTGNNVPKSLHKTRRTWRPNTSRVDWTVGSAAHAAFGGEAPVLSSSSNAAAASTMDAIAGRAARGAGSGRGASVVKGVKMQMRRRKDVEKAGGLEGLLLSRPSKHFTPFGQQLRSSLFNELHRIRASSRQDKRETLTAVNDAAPTTTTTSAAQGIPTGSGR